jgi:hypothetical protein
MAAIGWPPARENACSDFEPADGGELDCRGRDRLVGG